VVLQGRVDLGAVSGDLAGEVDERRDLAAPGPAQPTVEGVLAGLSFDGEDVSQAFL
jgi:hypothetical protein